MSKYDVADDEDGENAFVEEALGRLVPRDVVEQVVTSLEGLQLHIDKTWDGKPVVDHEPFNIHMNWHFERLGHGKAHKRVVKVMFSGPLFDDPPAPSEPLSGYCPRLWEHECVEFFFANDNDEYLEVEIGPHGHWLVYLLNGKKKVFNRGDDVEMNMQNTFEGNTWQCTFEIPIYLFPAKVTKLNCYAIHGSGKDRHYEAYAPVTDGTETEPDFHRLQYFKRFKSKTILAEGFNDTPFKHPFHGDLWAEKDKFIDTTNDKAEDFDIVY